MLSPFKSKLKTIPITAKEVHFSFSGFKINLNDQVASKNRKKYYWDYIRISKQTQCF